MTDEKKINDVVKQMNRHYFGSLALLIVLFALVLLKIVRFSEMPLSLPLAVNTYSIVIVLAAIPLVLKMFSNRLKKLTALKLAEPDILFRYKTAYFIRLYIFVVITLAIIVLYGFSNDMNYFWLTVVLLAVFMFCKSSYGEVASLLESEKDRTDKPVESNEQLL